MTQEKRIRIPQPDGSFKETVMAFPDAATDIQIDQIVREAVSGVTTGRVPTAERPGAALPPLESGLTRGQDLAVKATRFGPPLITAPVGLAASVPIAIASEAAAVRLEDFFKDPDSFDSIRNTLNQLLEGGEAGAIDALTFGLFKAGGAVWRKVAKRFAIGKEIPKDAQTALDMLQKATTKETGILAPTFAQMNPKARKFVNTMEAIGRASMGGQQAFNAMDDKSMKAVFDKFLSPYLLEEAEQMSRKEFGDFMTEMIGSLVTRNKAKGDILGTAFNPLEAYRKHLYDIRDAFVVGSQKKVNASAFRQKLVNLGEGPIIKDIRATLDISKGGNEFYPHLTSPKGIEKWKEMDIISSDNILKSLNSALNGADQNTARILNRLKDSLTPNVERAVGEISTDALNAWRKARDFYHIARTSGLYGDAIMSIRKTLSSKPATVQAMLDIPGQSKDLFANLMNFKQAMQFSDTVQKTAVYEGVNIASPFGEAGFEIWWKDSVLKPLRHSFITPGMDQSGNILINKLDSHIKRMFAQGDDYAKEIFQNPEIKQHLQDVMTTLKLVQRKPGRDTMFVNLMQGGQLLKGGTLLTAGLSGAAVGNVPLAKEAAVTTAIGTVIIFGTPRVFTEFLTSTRLVRMLTDGISLGPKSHAAIQLVRKLTTMKLAEEDALRKLSPEAFDYFTSIQQEEEPQSLTEQFEPLLFD